MFKKIPMWLSIGLIVVATLAANVYLRDMKTAYARVGAKSHVVPSPLGDIEYTQGGSGPDVLVIHGSGGGYDQGELLAQNVLGERFHWIAPSRFGYLRSTLRQGMTWDDQAHAYSHLLDHLGVKRVAVVAISHGGPSALLFAVLHPERVSSLTLISCGVAAASTMDQAQANQKGDMLVGLFKHDAAYWAMSRVLRKQLMGLMGANDAVIAGFTPAQREWVDRLIDEMNPVAPRSAGVVFDNRTALPGARIAAIRAPTLVVHAEDDTLQLFHNAAFAAATIPDARLMRFAHGGHLLMVVEQEKIGAAVQKHVSEHMGK